MLIAIIISLVVGAIGGAVGMFFALRNNPKYLGIDKLLKADRDQLLSLGKDKLQELVNKAQDALK